VRVRLQTGHVSAPPRFTPVALICRMILRRMQSSSADRGRLACAIELPRSIGSDDSKTVQLKDSSSNPKGVSARHDVEQASSNPTRFWDEIA